MFARNLNRNLDNGLICLDGTETHKNPLSNGHVCLSGTIIQKSLSNGTLCSHEIKIHWKQLIQMGLFVNLHEIIHRIHFKMGLFVSMKLECIEFIFLQVDLGGIHSYARNNLANGACLKA